MKQKNTSNTDFKKGLSEIFSSLEKRGKLGKISFQIRENDIWNTDIIFETEKFGIFKIENLKKNNIAFLEQLNDRLSEKSKELFCPYPWNDKKKLDSSFEKIIKKSENRVDASYILSQGDSIVGHFFLWKAGGNSHSEKYGVKIPELGIAIVDSNHGRGFGMLGVNLLKAVAKKTKNDAIELTTDTSNDAGWHTYLKSGFEYCGDINNPLEVDVTDVGIEKTESKKFRVERQMVYIINNKKNKEIKKYLEIKRNQFESI